MELQIKVAQAVHVLNHDSQSCNRVAANQWLVQFQHTNLSWDVVTSILTSDIIVIINHFFPISKSSSSPLILKRKIQNEGYYLQLGAKDALLNTLLLVAKRFTQALRSF